MIRMEYDSTIHILLVEDNEDDVYLIQTALSHCKVSIKRLEKGDAAVQYILNPEQHFDVMLLDNHLPGMDGLEVLRELKKFLIEIPVIFLTVEDNIDTVIEAMQHGAVDFLPKSRGYEELPEKVLRAYEIKCDRTRRKMYEKELYHAKKQAEAANTAKSRFLENMSHELRTPLNGIIGITNLMLKTEMTQEQVEFARLIKVSSEHLRNIINNILLFSRIESNDEILVERRCSFNAICSAVMKNFMYQAHEKGVTLTISVGRGVPAYMAADELKLQHIITNLVDNAIKFSEQGKITVSVEAEEKKNSSCCEVRHAPVIIRVSDQGIGIPKDKQYQLFESFYQIDGSNTRRYGGTGLGLAIVKKLVELMHGTISFTSQVDKGTTFIINIDVKEMN